MKKILYFLIILSVSLWSLQAESLIGGFSFEGLKKTKDSYMQELVKEYKGKEATEAVLKEIETLLQAQGLFTDIKVSVSEEDDSLINISVKEKVTFIPLPFISYSSDGLMGGFMLLNMNTFGQSNTLVAGGFFSSSMQMGMLIFSKPAKDIENPGFSNFTGFSGRADKITDFDDNRLDKYKYIQIRENLLLNEKINKYLSGAVGLGYSYMHFYENDMRDYHYWLLLSSFTCNKMDWNGWYLLSKNVSLSSETGYSSAGKFVQGFTCNASYQFPVMERNRVIINFAASLDSNKHPLHESERGSISCTIMNSDFRSDKMAGIMLSFEEALFKHNIANLSLYETYELAAAEDFDDSFVYCHGPGAGVKLYMNQIAFPAMNMGFSYNVTQNFFKFVISVGMSF